MEQQPKAAVKIKIKGPANALPGILRGMMRGKAEPEKKPKERRAKFSGRS